MVLQYRNTDINFTGKFNHRKLSVLATLYYYTVSLGVSGLSLQELVPRTGASYDYLRCRLPVFANASGKWRHQYILRRAALQRNRAVIVYSLSAYGRTWLEVRTPRGLFNHYVRILKPLWTPVER